MLFFRKALIRIRREYNVNPKALFMYSALASLLTVVIGIVADIFLPFESWGNVVRSVILIPTAASLFTLSYAVSLFMHYSRINSNPDWVPFRLRMSPSWRRRISAIVGAVLLVIMYASGFRIGYTPISSIFVAIAIGLFAFMRTTREEAAREEFNIPDVRDVRYNKQMDKLTEQRKVLERERLERRKEKRDKLLGLSEDE